MCHGLRECNLAFIPDSVVRPEEGEEGGELAGVLRHPPVRRVQHHVRSCKEVWKNLSNLKNVIQNIKYYTCQSLELPTSWSTIRPPTRRASPLPKANVLRRPWVLVSQLSLFMLQKYEINRTILGISEHFIKMFKFDDRMKKLHWGITTLLSRKLPQREIISSMKSFMRQKRSVSSGFAPIRRGRNVALDKIYVGVKGSSFNTSFKVALMSWTILGAI